MWRNERHGACEEEKVLFIPKQKPNRTTLCVLSFYFTHLLVNLFYISGQNIHKNTLHIHYNILYINVPVNWFISLTRGGRTSQTLFPTYYRIVLYINLKNVFFLYLFCLQMLRSNKKRETTPCICLNRTVYDITQKLSAELCRVSNHDETVVDSSCSSNFCPPDVTKEDCVHFRKLHLDVTATCFSPDLFLWLVTSCAFCLKGFIGWVDCSVIPLCTYTIIMKKE